MGLFRKPEPVSPFSGLEQAGCGGFAQNHTGRQVAVRHVHYVSGSD